MATAPSDPSQDLIERLHRCRASALAWLVPRLGADGRPLVGADQCYRLPFVLALVGERERAAAVLSWLERTVLKPDGDLAPGAMRDRFTHKWASYPLANIACGALQLERYDTAAKVVAALRRFQDEASGGAYAERPEARRTGRQDLFPTAQLGLTALMAGELAIAAAAYRWLDSLWRRQPGLPARLITATDGAGRLWIPPPEEPELRWEAITDFAQPRQAFYNPGIAAAFLGRYSMRTGDREARRLARDYFALAEGATPRQFDATDSVQVCKLGWGASVLLEADPAGPWLPWVIRMGEWFVGAQQSDGSWRESAFRRNPAGSEDKDFAVTVEFIQHVTTILTALAGRHRSPTPAPAESG